MKRLTFENPIDCAGCGACAAICPRKCIEMCKDSLGFNIPRFQYPEKCIDCGLCYKCCPQIEKRENQSCSSYSVYGQNKNRNDLAESSSGGFFSLLATTVIKAGGSVWGVEMLPDGNTSFCCIDSIDKLYKIRGSKYSEVNKPLDYSFVKKQLCGGKQVLVSGTPCQILGLRKYLGKTHYPNLILVDLLCYGIQSPKMWNLYLKDVNPENKRISSIKMRDKRFSWFNYSMTITFDDGTTYKKIRYKDPWLLTYSTSIFNRFSCSSCQSKKNPHVSDFTIGDFWDIDYYKNPIKLEKRKGVSLVIMHTDKALKLFDTVKNNFDYDVIPTNYMEKRNITLAQSAKISNLRDIFVSDACMFGFSEAVKKHLDFGLSVWYKKRKIYIKYKTIGKLKTIVKKLINYKK